MTETRITGSFTLDKLYTWGGEQFGPGEVTAIPCGLATQLADANIIPELTADQLSACSTDSGGSASVNPADVAAGTESGLNSAADIDTIIAELGAVKGLLQENRALKVSHWEVKDGISEANYSAGDQIKRTQILDLNTSPASVVETLWENGITPLPSAPDFTHLEEVTADTEEAIANIALLLGDAPTAGQIDGNIRQQLRALIERGSVTPILYRTTTAPAATDPTQRGYLSGGKVYSDPDLTNEVPAATIAQSGVEIEEQIAQVLNAPGDQLPISISTANLQELMVWVEVSGHPGDTSPVPVRVKMSNAGQTISPGQANVVDFERGELPFTNNGAGHVLLEDIALQAGNWITVQRDDEAGGTTDATVVNTRIKLVRRLNS